MNKPIFEISLDTKEKHIYIAVSEYGEQYSYYAFNKNTSTTINLMFDTLQEAIQQWVYDFGQRIDFVI